MAAGEHLDADDFQPVLRTPELGPGQLRQVRLGGDALVIANVGQTYYALETPCGRHAADAAIENDELVCRVDGARYDVRTGARLSPPGGNRLRRYRLRVEGNQIKVGPPMAG
jgi:3-phenylpropionate/trans-cinnamate dioxygenase ferredoxin component